MPVRYSFLGNLVRMDLEGTYSTEDIIRTFNAALSDPDFPGEPRFLLDVTRSAVLAERDAESVRAIAQYFAEHSPRAGTRLAIIATEPVHFGLARMGAAVAELGGAEVEVLTTIEDALSWLMVKTSEGPTGGRTKPGPG
jgi:hypothetical protein